MFSARVPRIMVVEDDPGHLLLICDSLIISGLSAHLLKTRDGQQALDYLLRRDPYSDLEASPRPDLILLDISMPIIDGYTVLKLLKKSDELRSIPVVVLTSRDGQEEINRCYAMGASGYLVKPVRPEDFREEIKLLRSILNILRFPIQT